MNTILKQKNSFIRTTSRMIKRAVICFFIFLNFHGASAQGILAAYTATPFNDGVLISFVMRGGYTCNGINIERSEDSLHFSVIGDIEGVCGSPDFDVSFSFIDTKPFANRNNFYRLDMKQLGYSPVLKVFFVRLDSNGTLLLPNPCNENCRLYFYNPKREKIIIELFQDGRIIESAITEENFFNWDLERFSPGTYVYRLQWPEGRFLKGRLLLLKP